MTTPTSHEDQLIERLHSLADTIDGPVPTAALARRGRAAVRRNRILGTAAALSVLTCTGVLGVGSGLLGHSGDPQALTGPAGSSKTAARSISAKHTAKRVSHHKAPDTSCSQTGPQRAHELDQEYG